jgi:subtilisin-like proprotein convertase family protein/catechol 2,3-dioxygenase-like lactoylglutathione lyase family enzyme
VIRAVVSGCRTYTIEPDNGELPDLTAVNFPIDVPDPATIDRVALRLDLTHNFMADLDATLQAPAGNRIALFDDIGSTTAGAFTRMLATFDDAGGTPPLCAWMKDVAVQPERYRLSWFAGQQAEGTWNLTFRDDAAGDTGTLARADLILCAQPEEGPVDTVFSADFEDGDDGFEHFGTADEWERGTPSFPARDREIDQTHLMYSPGDGRASPGAPADPPNGGHVMAEDLVSVRYIVSDVEEAIDFYTTHLGFSERMSALPAFADVVRGRLRLLLSGSASSGGRTLPDGRTPEPGGWNRIHLIVEDLAAEVERLRAAGLTFRSDIITGPGGSQIVLDDPSGNPIELFQPAAR